MEPTAIAGRNWLAPAAAASATDTGAVHVAPSSVENAYTTSVSLPLVTVYAMCSRPSGPAAMSGAAGIAAPAALVAGVPGSTAAEGAGFHRPGTPPYE